MAYMTLYVWYNDLYLYPQSLHMYQIIPYYCHMSNRSGYVIIDESGMYVDGEFYRAFKAAQTAVKHLTN